MCFKKKDREMVLSIYQISEGRGSPKMKKRCVIRRMSEELNSVRKREIFQNLKRESNIPPRHSFSL